MSTKLLVNLLLMLSSVFIIYYFIVGSIYRDGTSNKCKIRAFWPLAILQWFVVIPIIFIGTLLTYVFAPFVIWSSKNLPQPHGKPNVQYHLKKYTSSGSSGVWRYVMTDNWFLKYFGNYEDGLLGEPSGKWSANRNGNESTFVSQLLWLIRNPFNYAKRNSKLLACYVNDCRVISNTNGDVNDKKRDGSGSYQVVAIPYNKVGLTWGAYFGYRKVMMWDDSWTYNKITSVLVKLFGIDPDFFKDRVYNLTLGYKIKPSHSWVVQDDDDLDKALTFRVQLAKKGQWVTKK